MDKNFSIVLLAVLVFLIASSIGLQDRALIDWDEGVFAVQAQWLAHGFTAGKPFNFQTPPLFQAIIALLFSIFQDHGWLLTLVSVMASAASLMIVFLLARRLFDATTGLFAMLLFMTTEYFLFFSRSGLSDALFLLLFLAGLFFFHKGIIDRDNRSLLIAGICSVLVLYTKYSGFLLPLIFLIIGFKYRRTISWRWCLFTVIIPALLFLPYIIVFIKAVSLPGILTRHVSFTGIHHHQFLFYVARFAIIPVTLTVIGALLRSGAFDRERTGTWLIMPFLIMLVFIGLYYPYFRLAYPLVPLLCIIAARVLASTGRLKYWALPVCLVVALTAGWSTISYRSSIPEKIAARVRYVTDSLRIRYIYAITPPNVYFYLKGTILVPETNPSTKISPFSSIYEKNHMIMRNKDNLLENENALLLLYSSVCSGSMPGFDRIMASYNGRLIDSTEFHDAPVYYSDIFNLFRDTRQMYYVYVIDPAKLKPADRRSLWSTGQLPSVDVIRLGRP